MIESRGFHGVFAVPAAWLAWQMTFAIAEHAAVLPMRERAATPDQGKGAMRLGWQEVRQGRCRTIAGFGKVG